jgi:hypothetical protein
VVVCAADDAQRDADLCSDDSGGAYIVWEDNRLGTGREDIYAQQVDSLGTALLELDGRLVCAAANNQNRPDVHRGAGGLLTAWKDDRDVLYEPDVYADRVLTTGNAVIGVNRVSFDFGVATRQVVSDTFVVSNVGASNLTVQDVILAVQDPVFTLHYPRPLPDTLLPGDMVHVAVTFTPAAALRDTLVYFDTVLVYHDAPDMLSPVTVTLRGAAVVTAMPDEDFQPLPTAATLSNHPNPFNPRTTIVFDLPRTDHVALQIHDLTGRLVKTLLSGDQKQPGSHRVIWDGTDDRGQAVASGIYLCRLETAEILATRRMVLMR